MTKLIALVGFTRKSAIFWAHEYCVKLYHGNMTFVDKEGNTYIWLDGNPNKIRGMEFSKIIFGPENVDGEFLQELQARVR